VPAAAGSEPATGGHRTYTLTGADGLPYESARPGALGGNRAGLIYGRLDCPTALRAIERGGYVAHRVFFADEPTARAAGYRPCGHCLRVEYRAWKAAVRSPGGSPEEGAGPTSRAR
jgi:hypothetical protein